MRHGQSEWNAIGRWQGWADPPLSSLGRRQSKLAGEGLPGIEVVVSSDLRRAVDTAALMAEPLGLEVSAVEPRLRERDVGAWTGLTRAEIERRWPEALAVMADPPGGENAATVVARASAAVAQLASTYAGEVVLAVTHGGVIRGLERALGVDPDPLPNLGGTWLEISSDHTMVVGPRVLLVDPAAVAVTVPRQL